MIILKKFERLVKATLYSVSGLRFAFQDEAAFREIIFLACLGIPTAFVMAQTFAEIILLTLPFFICIVVELLNTAIENICDAISPAYNEYIKKAKDMGSAAQFVSQIFLVATWIIYLIMRQNYDFRS